MSVSEDGTVYGFNLLKQLLYSPAKGYLCIQLLKLYMYYYVDIHLKDVNLALSLGTQNLNACKKYQLYNCISMLTQRSVFLK